MTVRPTLPSPDVPVKVNIKSLPFKPQIDVSNPGAPVHINISFDQENTPLPDLKCSGYVGE